MFSEAGSKDDMEEMARLVEEIESRPAESFPDKASHFRLSDNRDTYARRRSEEKYFRTFLNAFPDLKELRVLDVSCGVGREAQILLERGARDIMLLDVSFPAVAYAKHKFDKYYPDRNLCYLVSEAMCLPFPDKIFDVVLVYSAAHHYPDLPAFLKEASRVSRSVCLLAEPAKAGCLSWLLERVGWSTEYGSLPTPRLNEQALREAVGRAGLIPDVQRCFNYYPRFLDPLGNFHWFVDLWFAGLACLDRLLPSSIAHSISLVASDRS